MIPIANGPEERTHHAGASGCREFQDLVSTAREKYENPQILTDFAGKTFLIANTIHRMQQKSSSRVIFLFLTHNDQSQGRILEIFTSILFQEAKNDEALKSTLLEEIRFNRSKLSSNIDIRKITLDLLSSCGSIIVVIDGLDEIDEYSRKPLLEALLELSGSSDNIKLLVSSRAERDIAKILRDKAVSIKIDVHNQDDIQKFIELEGKSWIDELKDCESDEAMLIAAEQGLLRVQRKSEGKQLLFCLLDHETSVHLTPL